MRRPRGRPAIVIQPIRLNLYIPTRTYEALLRVSQQRSISLSQAVTLAVNNLEKERKEA